MKTIKGVIKALINWEKNKQKNFTNCSQNLTSLRHLNFKLMTIEAIMKQLIGLLMP